MGDIEGGAVSHGTSQDRLELYKAALANDWKKAEIIYRESEMEYGTMITWDGETALHVAAFSGNTDFVEKLVEKMNVNEIRIQMKKENENDENGNTAFHCAAVSGNVKTAEAILSKDDSLLDLTMARDYGNNLPIYVAAVKGNKKMVRYLYEKTKDKLQDPNRKDLDGDRKELLLTLIKSDIYDVALKMAKALIDQNIAPESMEEVALEALAKKPLILFPGCELVQLLWDKITHNESRARRIIDNNHVENVIFKAAILGNFKFLSILIASYPRVLLAWDNNYYTIFHHAILNRHVDIFKLIRIGSVRTFVTTFRDNDGNNMLHLAGKLPPPYRLNIVPGAALQLQRELLWFEEVKKMMAPHQVMQKAKSIQDKTEEYCTPYELLIKEHKQLMAEGEKWMRDTANSCMIVTALITTIAFAAAITIPGGNGDDGYPHFASEPLLKAFAVADSVSLVSSTTSLLTFLSILTARYTIDDFRWSLPNKLFIGLLTLFVSIVAIMVAFVLSIFIIFKNTPPVLTLLLVAVSSLPIIIFIWHHSRLFLDLFHSTYKSHLLFKPAKDPNLLIKEKMKYHPGEQRDLEQGPQQFGRYLRKRFFITQG